MKTWRDVEKIFGYKNDRFSITKMSFTRRQLNIEIDYDRYIFFRPLSQNINANTRTSDYTISDEIVGRYLCPSMPIHICIKNYFHDAAKSVKNFFLNLVRKIFRRRKFFFENTGHRKGWHDAKNLIEFEEYSEN